MPAINIPQIAENIRSRIENEIPRNRRNEERHSVVGGLTRLFQRIDTTGQGKDVTRAR